MFKKCKVIPVHKGGADVVVHSFLNQTLDAGKWLASLPDNYTAGIH